MSQSIYLLTNTLVRFLGNQIPALGARVLQNLSLLAGRTFLVAGVSTLLPTLSVIAVNILGFMAGGVLRGSIAALIQSVIFGGQTSGLFSVLQAFGATATISPVGAVIGVILAVIGTGIQYIGPRLQ